jgi:uncharacterized membrane protein
MNGAHFHLLVNHIPIIGTIFGLMILLAGLILKNNTVKQTGLGTLIFTALSISVVLFSGDPAGDAVKGLPGVMESMIEHHETIAYSSLWAIIPMGLLAALAFYSIWKNERSANALAWVTFFLGVIAMGLMAWVGLTGGEIRHTEIRPGNTAIMPASSQENEDSDDD